MHFHLIISLHFQAVAWETVVAWATRRGRQVKVYRIEKLSTYSRVPVAKQYR
jgi:hypothetical protein